MAEERNIEVKLGDMAQAGIKSGRGPIHPPPFDVSALR
jgi:hypothetical protein